MKKEMNPKKIERNLSFKRIKKQKKYSIQILCISFLACALIQLDLQMTSGIIDAFRESRKEVYGEWERMMVETDYKDRSVARDNPFLEKTGEINIYGVLEGDYLENTQWNIGTMDEDAWNLGRLELKEGKFPENENEIAMEYSMLVLLGYEDKIGEKITLRIIPSIEFHHEETSVELSYTLCGIIKDYQVNWDISLRHRLPTGIVTNEGAERIGSPLETHMLIKAKDGYENVYEDMEKSEDISCAMVENFSDGRLITDKIPYEDFLITIRILIAGSAICVLFITISHSIDGREQFWKFLYALGMVKSQMVQMILWEAGIYGSISLTIGTLMGVALYKISLPVLKVISGQNIISKIFVKSMLNGILWSGLIIVTGYLLSCMRLNKILKSGGERRNKKIKKRRSCSISKFTPFSVVMSEWKYKGVRKIVQILLLSSAISIVLFGILEVRNKKVNMEEFKQTTGNGYSLDTTDFPEVSGIRKSDIALFSQIAGVESVETYQVSASGEFTIDLSEYSDNRYFQEVVKTEQNFNENVEINKISLSVLGVNEWENIERFVRNMTEGSINQNDFQNGNFCILLLPPLEKTSYGYLGNVTEEEYQESFLMENDLKVGDTLKISHWEVNGYTEEKQIQISGILRTAKKEDIRSPFPGGSGIQIIVGEKFWKTFQVNNMNEYCQKVRINLSDDADVFDTEEHLLKCIKKMGTVNIDNYHQEYIQRQQDMYSFQGMYSVFTVFYLILVFIVLYQMLEAEEYEANRSLEIFRALGMEEEFIRKKKKIEIGVMGILAVLGSGIVALGVLLLSRPAPFGF